MTITEAKNLLPGNKVVDPVTCCTGVVQAIGYRYEPDDEEHYVKVTVHFNDGFCDEHTLTYVGDQVEWLERVDVRD